MDPFEFYFFFYRGEGGERGRWFDIIKHIKASVKLRKEKLCGRGKEKKRRKLTNLFSLSLFSRSSLITGY